MRTFSLQPETIEGSRSPVTIGRLSVHRHVMHKGAHLRSAPRSNSIRVGMIVSEAPNLAFCGNPLVHEELAVAGEGILDLYARGTSTLIWIDVDRSLFDTAIDEKIMSLLASTFRPDSAALQDLRAACMLLLSTSPAVDEEQSAIRVIESLEAVFRDAARVRGYTKESKRRYDLVRRAEEYMWAHIEEPIDPASIAGALNCSVRKMLYYFKRTYGLGPIGYFKIQRLNAVREALTGDRSRRTIADIAADYGFWHMGHFGAAYRELFGVTPSQTRTVVCQPAESVVEYGFRPIERYIQPVSVGARSALEFQMA